MIIFIIFIFYDIFWMRICHPVPTEFTNTLWGSVLGSLLMTFRILVVNVCGKCLYPLSQFSISWFQILLHCVCVCMNTLIMNDKTNVRMSENNMWIFCSFFLYVSEEIKLWLSGLIANDFTHWAIFPTRIKSLQ